MRELSAIMKHHKGREEKTVQRESKAILNDTDPYVML